MSRKRKNHDEQRDASDVATDSEVLRSFIKKNSFKPAPLLSPQPPQPLTLFDDNRRYHPNQATKPATATQRRHSRLVIPAVRTQSSRPQGLPSRVKFAAPSHVAVCIRRKTRKQVLFAKRLYRKGHSSKRRLNTWSRIKC